MRIVTIVGARPQFIKAAAVSHAIARRARMHETLLHTGQHFDAGMSAVFFDELDIPPPAANLDIHGGGHGEMTGRMLERIEHELMKNRPDCVLVYGDTNSTLAGALAAAKLHVPVAHVEAGLRSFNRRMPEEINRVLAGHACDLLFAPTEAAVRNLVREGIEANKVRLAGDVMYDAALRFGRLAAERSGILQRLGLAGKPYVLCTIHRAENTGDLARLRNILAALDALAKDIPVVFPIHPRTQDVLARNQSSLPATNRLIIIDPVGYLDMVRLETGAALIATDSGGVQKEAFFHRVPCVTLRDETEWVELVEAGWNRLAPPDDMERLLQALRAAMSSSGSEASPYGSGDAAGRIAQALECFAAERGRGIRSCP